MIQNTYFMPYLGEPDPTYYMTFNGSTKCNKLNHLCKDFKPKYSPQTSFIRFAREVACFIQPYQSSGGLSSGQYAALISPHFTEEEWETMCRCRPSVMLSIYARTHYHWRQRRHDFRQRRFLPSYYHYGYHQMRYHNLLSSYLKYPEESISFALYTASLEVAERIVCENYEIFNDAGFVVSLGERDADAIIQRAASQDKDRIKGEPMSFLRDYGDTLKETSRAKRRLEQTETAQFPPKRRNSSRYRYVIPSCSMEEWKNGKAKQECIEAWNELPNVPLRTFQSFTYPTMWKS